MENTIFDAGPSPFSPENPYVMKDDQAISLPRIEPIRTFTFTSPDGRKAVLDFGGDEMTYSGDLPVAESAKMFFDEIAAHWR